MPRLPARDRPDPRSAVVRRRRPAAGPLPRTFFERPVTTVARALLGRLLVYDGPGGRVAGRIVEVEAYGGPRDPASHAYRGRTARNAVMFEGPGRLYVYFTYGMHHCLNVVCEPEARAAAVLIRAVEPADGLEAMRRRRGVHEPTRLARGPGCVAQAYGLDLRHNGIDLTRGPVWIDRRPARRGGRRLATSVRIGVGAAASRRWRYFLDGHPCVSGSRRPGGGTPRRNGAPVAPPRRHPR